jgi:hypothetical protein
MINSLLANLVRPPKPASPRRTGSGGNTANALAVPRGQARQSGEPAFAAPIGFSDTPGEKKNDKKEPTPSPQESGFTTAKPS